MQRSLSVSSSFIESKWQTIAQYQGRCCCFTRSLLTRHCSSIVTWIQRETLFLSVRSFQMLGLWYTRSQRASAPGSLKSLSERLSCYRAAYGSNDYAR